MGSAHAETLKSDLRGPLDCRPIKQWIWPQQLILFRRIVSGVFRYAVRQEPENRTGDDLAFMRRQEQPSIRSQLQGANHDVSGLQGQIFPRTPAKIELIVLLKIFQGSRFPDLYSGPESKLYVRTATFTELLVERLWSLLEVEHHGCARGTTEESEFS